MILGFMTWLAMLLLWYTSKVNGLVHFYTNAGVKQCLYKDLRQGLVLLGWYKMEIMTNGIYHVPYDKNLVGVVINVEETFDSNHRVVHQKGAALGQFTFTAIDSGQHRICFTPKSFIQKKWLQKLDDNLDQDSRFEICRLSLELSIADASSIDSRGFVNSLTNDIHTLNNKLIDIIREQQFIHQKEVDFRDLSELVCERVVAWMAVQIGLFIIIFIYQYFKVSQILRKEKQD